MQKLFRKKLTLSVLTVLFISCASTAELPSIPDYGTRSDYPNLMKTTKDVEGDTQYLETNRDSFLKTHEMVKDYSEQLNCAEKGRVVISFVVTKEAKVDAPEFEKTLSANCDRAALLALIHLKFDKPLRINGEPINYEMLIPFVFNKKTTTRDLIDSAIKELDQ